MILRSFSLSTGFGAWDSDAERMEGLLLAFCSSVANSRIRTALKREKLLTTGIADIAIVPTVEKLPEPQQFAHILPVHVLFDWQAFSDWLGDKAAVHEALNSNDPDAFSKLHGPSDVIRDMICGAMLRSLGRVPERFNLPTAKFEQMVHEIHETPYELAWTYCSRRFAQLDLTARLECLLLAGEFRLSLSLLRRKQIVWTRVIFSSWPEAMFWHGAFKDVELLGDTLVVTRRIGNFNQDQSLDFDLFSLPLNEIPT